MQKALDDSRHYETGEALNDKGKIKVKN